MAIDHSPASKPTGKWGIKSLSKEEIKMALVAKRLAMLQDDDHAHNLVLSGCTKQLKRTTNEIRDKDDANLSVSCNYTLEITAGTNPVSDCKEDLSSGSDIVVFSPRATHGKNLSRKRTVVSSDNESEQDGLIQPTKKESKRVKKTDESTVKLSPVLKLAKEIQANLSAEYPSFIRDMKPSHVAGGFWLGLPGKACDAFLPICDCDVVLIDEDGKKFTCKYLFLKKGLSGGWRKFSIEHELSEGDAVIFQKVAPATFQVYIVRKDRQDIVDGALGLVSLDCDAGQHIVETKDHARGHEVVNVNVSPLKDCVSPSDSDFGSEVLNGICLSDSDVNFEAVKGFMDFKIIVDGLVYDSKFLEANRKKYYELCRSQNTFLHEQLIKGMNCKLVAGSILETINIADAVLACTSSTPTKHLQLWEQTLTGLKCLGMKVDFLLAKLHQLLGFASDFDKSHMFEKYIHEQGVVNERMIALENQLIELRAHMEKVDREMKAEMTRSAQRHEARVKEMANTPW